VRRCGSWGRVGSSRDWQAGWGLGFRIQRLNGKTSFGHGGSLPGYRTQLRIWPAEKLAVIAMVERAQQYVGPPSPR